MAAKEPTMLFSKFSNPYQGNFLPLAENLSCRTFRALLDKANGFADELGVPRIPIPRDAITPQRLSVRGWMPEMGAAALGLTRNVTKDNWSWISGQFQLAAFLNGLVPSLEVDIVASHPLAVAGHFVHGDRFIVTGDHTVLTIRNGAGDTVLRLNKLDTGGISAVWVENEQAALRVGSSGSAVLTNDEWLRYWHPEARRGIRSAEPGSKGRFEATMALLEERLPEYFVWIAGLLREVAPLEECTRGTHSQSFSSWPGHVHVPVTSPLTTIVMLIHECSHQYFHLLQWNTRVEKVNAPKAYSVLMKTERPLDKILLGFHAFGNILLALQALDSVKGVFEPAEMARHQAENRAFVVGMDRELQVLHDEHLEGAGKDIYLPLRAKLVAADVLPSA
ncbi:HEXXH motif domain-containing protein [Cystobacter fuscus]|uniref:HEXXH motif domain-containing protein n=1 Tax=Cystobacter fuscus TaxID=43 RepID=A0A250J6Q3_9BACT|nr:HEXXH motif-containing putative peptide modification protein [Cystobacter fuscus]ATB39198.1 HEXXH motif domain-containing protein [Cystobacter fuscus]